MNIRLTTGLIIRKGPDFYVGKVMYGTELRWSWRPWDAWWTRNREDAEEIARITGGDLWLFNPVAGQLKEVER